MLKVLTDASGTSIMGHCQERVEWIVPASIDNYSLENSTDGFTRFPSETETQYGACVESTPGTYPPPFKYAERKSS